MDETIDLVSLNDNLTALTEAIIVKLIIIT